MVVPLSLLAPATKMRWRLPVAALSLVVLVLLGSAEALHVKLSPRFKPRYLWPLTRRFGLSSSFAEYRNCWLHAGIDLKTAGVTGLRVRAIERGVIFRLCVKYRGLGRAVYIRHPNGLISVYGHLERFENRRLHLEDKVAEARARTGSRYPGDILVEVPVKRGQTIGFSGESGYGFPHLHLELRRNGTCPLNPLLIFHQKDRTAPVIKSVVLSPVGPESFANCQHDDVIVPLARKRRGRYSTKDRPRVFGKFVVEVHTYDTIGAANHCGVYRIALRADGRLVYSLRFDELEYDRNIHRTGLVFDHRYAYFRPRQYVYALHNRYGAEKPGELASVNGGILDFTQSPGPHRLTLNVWDAAGNRSTATLHILALPRPPRPALPKSYARHGATNDGVKIYASAFRSFVQLVLSLPGLPALETLDDRLPRLIAQRPGGKPLPLDLYPCGDGRFLAAFAPRSATGMPGPIEFRALLGESDTNGPARSAECVVGFVPSSGGTLRFDGMLVEFEPGTLYTDQLFVVTPVLGKAMPGVPIVSGDILRIRPEGIPLEKRAKVTFACPDNLPAADVARAGVYQYNPKRSDWKYLDNQLAGNNGIAADVCYLSYLALCVDKAPPKIVLLRPRLGRRLKRRNNRLLVKITDVGSGVDHTRVVATIDGVPIDAEYDPDRELLRGTFDLPQKRRFHLLHIEAFDIAGNPALPLNLRFR